MKLFERAALMAQLGKVMHHLSNDNEWSVDEMGITKEQYDQMQHVVRRVHVHNGWFTETAVRDAFDGISKWLDEKSLTEWAGPYAKEGDAKNVAIIMAGNIPLVGFHDFLSVFMSGNKALIKLSSDDRQLFPALFELIIAINPEIKNWVEIREAQLTDFDAVIATGSNNSANYFESYFGRYPNIIRKNRHSIAVLKGDETKDEIKELGKDVFAYFGLGCRNVTQVLIPKEFILSRLFEGFFDYQDIVNHNKYANNYDYNKAVYLMNREELLDNGFLLLKEDEKLSSPLGMLHYKRYEKEEDVTTYLNAYKDEIQAIVGKDYIPFGKAQSPELTDYADYINTLEFLTKI